MKRDLDALMESSGLDAILVVGDSRNNAPMRYLMGRGQVGRAVLVRKRNAMPVVCCSAMERDEAASSGLQVMPLVTAGVDSLLQDPSEILQAQALIKGRVGLYGTLDVGDLLAILGRIRQVFPDLEVITEPRDDSILLRAMETKDEGEVERIRQMGRITTEVVGKVAALLTSSRVREDQVLLRDDDSPLAVADVKARISLWLAERGAEQLEGCIFAIGRDAGVPHSMGASGDLLRLGSTIVIDVFPSEAGGGYFYDFTRTWSLGYATAEAQKLYDEVRSAYEDVIQNIDLNVGFKECHKLVCEQFHRDGHQTPIHTQGVLEHGYVHSLGHGVGLNVHERPWSRHTAGDDNLLKPGVVISVEPGLYYPAESMGVRLEDTYWMRPDGQLELLAEYPYDFVLPMKHWRPA